MCVWQDRNWAGGSWEHVKRVKIFSWMDKAFRPIQPLWVLLLRSISKLMANIWPSVFIHDFGIKLALKCSLCTGTEVT